METMWRLSTKCNPFVCMIFIHAFIHFEDVLGIEEPHREIHLQPRNFNPHPYEADLRASRRMLSDRGPILFPPSPAPSTEKSNFIKVENNLINRNNGHPVDRHPYAKVANKYRFSNPGRHQVYENEIDPQISAALSNHANKVLGRPVPVYSATVPFIDEQKKYAFSYKVVDHLTGDDFSHTQSQNEKATRGEYRVKLPDGRVQIVSYTADKDGYKADVKYEDEILRAQQKIPRGHDYRHQIDGYGNLNYDSERYVYNQGGVHVGVKSTPSTPIHENHVEDYDYSNRKPVSYAPAPTQSPGFIFAVTRSPHHEYLQPSPTPAYRYEDDPQDQHHDHRFRIIPQDKVEIVNQGDAPAYLENPGVILSSTPSPSPFSGDYQHVFVTRLPDIYSGKK
ncbi:hypothetical protein WA026_018504 [Henosepilachna vigintioctopunctata]|uniref:Uncharacterized protein n=1 Tax=Henosepilachna vigintioctopunctata TaxID=420089 RepID=A0AAW1UWJ6_9CUCU